MSSRFEWAHASMGPELVPPDELDELAPDGNDDGEWGLAWMTGSDGCMVYGSLEDLHAMAVRIGLMVESEQRRLNERPDPLGPPNPAHAALDDELLHASEVARRMRGDVRRMRGDQT